MLDIRQLTADEARQCTSALADVLLDCVQGGASVSFMASLTKPAAEAYFTSVIQGVQNGDRILLAALIDAELVGTVQIVTAMPPNQPHRADVAKLLVRRTARRQGIGSQLMQQAEEASRRAGKTLLVLDTATGSSAERLYETLGWTKVGVIPGYAMYPDGAFGDTTFFWKQLWHVGQYHVSLLAYHHLRPGNAIRD